MIARKIFGRTGHESSRVIFGAYALNKATQAESERVLDLLLEYGINHIDTAPMYGNAEKQIGPWMDKHRDRFFLATKTRSRTYKGAWSNLERSLERLRVDHIDLWQMHGLTNPQGWEKAMGEGGTLEAFLEARDKGLVRHLGVTGHGIKTPGIHLLSIQHFDFDTVMLPYNYVLMRNPRYADDFEKLVRLCRERDIAVQTIKSIALRPWKGRPKTHNTYFYEPFVTQDAIDLTVHWAMGFRESFVITAGDINVLPKVLEAANRFVEQPPQAKMDTFVGSYGIEPVFS